MSGQTYAQLKVRLPRGRAPRAEASGHLPKRLGTRLALRRVRESVPLLVDKHCGRLRWDFVQRLDRSLASLERALDQRLDGTVQSLRAGIARAGQDRARSERRADDAEGRLNEARDRIGRLERALEDLLGVVARAGEAR